jgi:hypothetical protein
MRKSRTEGKKIKKYLRKEKEGVVEWRKGGSIFSRWMYTCCAVDRLITEVILLYLTTRSRDRCRLRNIKTYRTKSAPKGTVWDSYISQNKQNKQLFFPQKLNGLFERE